MESPDLEQRPGPLARVRVTEWGPAGQRLREDRVVAEEPLEIRLAGPHVPTSRIWVTMRTPGHDFELAAGYCLHEGLVSLADVQQVAYCTDADLRPEQEFNVVTVTVAGPADSSVVRRLPALSVGSSACGVCGKDSIESVLRITRRTPWAGALPDPDLVRTLPDRLRAEQKLFEATGGVHAAGLFTDRGEPLVVREDVGRHNAVDKVTGARVLAGQDPAAACLVVSGRASFELVQKAVSAGIGSLVAVGAPSSLAVRLAQQSGLTLYGFASSQRCVRYV